jgi:hypothetical protein
MVKNNIGMGSLIFRFVCLNPFGAKWSSGYLLEKNHGPIRLPYAIYRLSVSDDMIGLRAGLHNFI